MNIEAPFIVDFSFYAEHVAADNVSTTSLNPSSPFAGEDTENSCSHTWDTGRSRASENVPKGWTAGIRDREKLPLTAR